MDSRTVWIIIVGMAGIAYGLRISFIFLFGQREIPPLVQRALRFVPGAVLSALVFPAMLYQNRVLALSPDNDRLLAGAIAALVAWRTNNVFLTILVGMVALWVFGSFDF